MKKFATLTASAAILGAMAIATASPDAETSAETRAAAEADIIIGDAMVDNTTVGVIGKVVADTDEMRDRYEWDGTVAAEIEALNHIISILIDAEALYADAANIPDSNEQVRDILAQYAIRRGDQAIELQERVAALGGTADEWGEAIGTTHRALTQFRTLFDNDTEVAIEEVLRGERYIVDEIGEALTGDLTPQGEIILEALRVQVVADIERLETLDDVS